MSNRRELEYRLSDDKTYWILRFPQGPEMFFDLEDYALIKPHAWFLTSLRKYKRTQYAGTSRPIGNGKYTTLSVHRLIMNLSDRSVDIDHINGNGLDNRRLNLRLATRSQNLANLPAINGRKYKGVHVYSTKRKGSQWRAKIQIHGKQINIGAFDSELEAAKAYNRAAIEHFGEFARINEVP